MPLFLLFAAIPIIEIALFIQVGGVIGLWPTLAIVVGTAILGSWMIRTQGAMAMARLRESLATAQDPTEPLAHGAMILVAGVLLLTPGFFTDTLGFLLLLPPVRTAAFRYLRSRMNVQTFGTPPGSGPGPRPPFRDADGIIDGEFEEIDPADTPPNMPPRGQSGWTRH